MKSTVSFLLDHGLTLLTGSFAGAAIALGLSSFESISFWIWSLLTFSILIIAFKKLVCVMTTKGDSILRVEYLPACLFCFLIGASWNWDFWTVTSSIGSLLAGTGTVGLLWFGWLKSDEWKHRLYEEKRLDRKTKALDELNYSVFKLQLQVEALISSSQNQLTFNPLELFTPIKNKLNFISRLEWTAHPKEFEELISAFKELSTEMAALDFCIQNINAYPKNDLKVIVQHCDKITEHSNNLLSSLLMNK